MLCWIPIGRQHFHKLTNLLLRQHIESSQCASHHSIFLKISDGKENFSVLMFVLSCADWSLSKMTVNVGCIDWQETWPNWQGEWWRCNRPRINSIIQPNALSIISSVQGVNRASNEERFTYILPSHRDRYLVQFNRVIRAKIFRLRKICRIFRVHYVHFGIAAIPIPVK